MSNTTLTCGTTTVTRATQTEGVLYNKQFFEDLYKQEYPTTGVESLCGDSYKRLYDMSLEKISKLETDLQNSKLAQHHDHLGMVRRLAEEYESRLSSERMKQFTFKNEIEQLEFKYRKLLLDYEKLKILLKDKF